MILKWFWCLVVVGSVAWYSVLIFYVGIKGAHEIVGMLRRLSGDTRKTG